MGDRTPGMIGLVFAHTRPMTDVSKELLVALCQPMALAMELMHANRAASEAAKERAVLAERNRMARDVHDTLAQGFTAISLQLQAAARAKDPEECRQFVARATEEALSNLVESRHAIRMLRGQVEASGSAATLAHALEDALSSRLAGSSMRWRVRCVPEYVAEPRLTDENRRELKRIAQEAATNALKHSKASFFEAQLSICEAQLSVRLVDDGQGFDLGTQQDGFGLLGMRERAHRISAKLDIESGLGQPTTVVVTLPLAQPPQGALA